MNKIENKQKIKLKKLLINKFWTVKQFHEIINSDKKKLKTLFNNIPGILVSDFFSTNIINEIKIIKKSPMEIKLVATGIDNIVWTYKIFIIN